MTKENPIQEPLEYPLSKDGLRKSEEFDNQQRDVIFRRIKEGKLPSEIPVYKNGKQIGFRVNDFEGNLVYYEANAMEWTDAVRQNEDLQKKLKSEELFREKKSFEEEHAPSE